MKCNNCNEEYDDGLNKGKWFKPAGYCTLSCYDEYMQRWYNENTRSKNG